MQIKCPKCSVAYDLPKQALEKQQVGGKPQKVRCFKCKTVFKVALREKKKPDSGYEEFSNARPLPELDKEDTQDNLVLDGVSQQPVREPSQAEKELMLAVFDYQEQPPETGPEKDGPQPSPAAVTGPAVNMVTSASLWTDDNALDLTGYAVGRHMITMRRYFAICGIVAASVLLLGTLFVAARNDWSLSSEHLGGQISYAFFGSSGDAYSDGRAGLSATVHKQFVIVAADGRRLLVVNGKVENYTPIPRNRVMLDARLIDDKGSTVLETTVPCGRVRHRAKLRRVKHGKFDQHYRDGKEYYNCVVRKNTNRNFQVVFDDLPKSYDNTHTIDVKINSAKAKLAKR